MGRSEDGEYGEIVGEGIAVSGRLYLFLIVGFVLAFVGVAVILVAKVLYGGGPANVGAVIFIGPFPIVIGASLDVSWIILLSIVLAVQSIVVILIMNRKLGRAEG